MKGKLFASVLFGTLTAACGADGDEIARMKVSGIPGTFIVEDAHRGTPLTAVEHRLLYENAGERELLFHGYGGQSIHLSLLGTNSLLVSYCEGSVEELRSSFLLSPPEEGQDIRLIRLQAVTETGLSAGDRAIC